MGQIKFTISLVLTGLFMVALITLVVSFGTNNNAATQLGDDSKFTNAQNNVKSNLTAFRENSGDDVLTSYLQTQAEGGDQVSTAGTQFKGGITNTINIAKDTFTLAYHNIFGEDEGFGIFLTTLLAMIAFVAAMYGYKTWFGRSPD